MLFCPLIMRVPGAGGYGCARQRGRTCPFILHYIYILLERKYHGYDIIFSIGTWLVSGCPNINCRVCSLPCTFAQPAEQSKHIKKKCAGGEEWQPGLKYEAYYWLYRPLLAAGSNDKIRGDAISSGLLRKKGSLSSPVPHQGPSHILHFQPSINTPKHTQTHAHTHIYRHDHADTHAHTPTHTHTNIHTQTKTHTHTHALKHKI